MIKGAVLDGMRRYRLWRIWEPQKPLLLYVLLNPSHADADTNDRTVAKLIEFSKNFGYGGFYLGNLHSYITPDPKQLEPYRLPNESINVFHIKEMVKKCEKVVFGWGNAAEIPHWRSSQSLTVPTVLESIIMGHPNTHSTCLTVHDWFHFIIGWIHWERKKHYHRYPSVPKPSECPF